MRLLKHIFFLLFTCTLLVTSFQFSLFDLDDISKIQLVEEEQEDFGMDNELLEFEYSAETSKIKRNDFHTYDAAHFFELHAKNFYPKIYLAVPYSPPKLM